MDAVADDETAVVVHEGDHVHAPVLPLEDEGEQVGLPQLVGAAALEVLDALGVWPGRDLLDHVALLLQVVADRARAGAQPLAAREHVVDAILAPLGVRLLHQQDGALRLEGETAALLRPATLVLETGGTELLEATLPEVEGVDRESDQGAEVLGGELAAQPGVQEQQALAGRVVRARRERDLRLDATTGAPARSGEVEVVGVLRGGGLGAAMQPVAHSASGYALGLARVVLHRGRRGLRAEGGMRYCGVSGIGYVRSSHGSPGSAECGAGRDR